MIVERIGYGAGVKEFPQANLLRIWVGEVEANPQASNNAPLLESIVLLETNLDDAAGVTIGHAVELLWDAGALDVSLAAIQMKKGRPGVLLSVQAAPGDADRLQAI